MKNHIAVVIESDWNWPTALELDKRNAVIAELKHLKVGKFVRAGFGPGTMDFSYAVHDIKEAKAMISKAIFKHLAGRGYTVQAVSRRSEIQGNAANTNVKPTCGMEM